MVLLLVRLCTQPNCTKNETESEIHFLLNCQQHSLLRTSLFNKIILKNFHTLSQSDIFIYLLTCPKLARQVGQYILDAFDNRVEL